MNSSKYVFAIAGLACLLVGCGRSPNTCSPRKGEAELKLLIVDHASADAALAFKSGDRRLLGVYGFSTEIPGLTGDPYQHMSETRMLKGTGDVFCTKEEELLNNNARIYAKKYNKTMLSLISELQRN